MPNTRTEGFPGLLMLLQLSDSALPTGAFSHSFGLETYLQREIVHSADTFEGWLVSYLRQMAYVDALAVRLTAVASLKQDNAGVVRIDQLLHASSVPRQVRQAGVDMGARMSQIVETALPEAQGPAHYRAAIEDGECRGHPAIVFALAATDVGVSIEDTVGSYLMQLATSLTQNAIRAIPLGQDAGQRVLSRVRVLIPEIVQYTGGLNEYDLGASAPGLEIAQMVHETQRARMFMS